MKYNSTRGGAKTLTASQAILKGLADDGGLYAPDSFPKCGRLSMGGPLDYRSLAVHILRPYLTDFTDDEITGCVATAYDDKFDTAEIAPVIQTSNGLFILELFHGKTLAFKDMALSLLPRLMLNAARKNLAGDRKILILTATSGDTGKAALEGYADVDGCEIAVFYPEDGVSDIQKKQMTTQRGGNTAVIGIKGNFDDAQAGVKRLFNDKAFTGRLADAGYTVTSANSINIGRLLPQIVYYFHAYAQMVSKYGLPYGDAVNFTVPTGNFGNILAGFYAKQMGLNINRLICASNDNNVLTDFFNTGEYNVNRPFIRTISPSMDILVSSNLERFLYHTGGTEAAQKMKELIKSGVFRYNPQTDMIAGYSATEPKTREAIKEMHLNGYTMDPHTAVAYECHKAYIRETGDNTPNIIVATASPYKFAFDVCRALDPGYKSADAPTAMRELSRITGTPIPPALEELDTLEIRHKTVCRTDEMESALCLHLKNYQK